MRSGPGMGATEDRSGRDHEPGPAVNTAPGSPPSRARLMGVLGPAPEWRRRRHWPCSARPATPPSALLLDTAEFLRQRGRQPGQRCAAGPRFHRERRPGLGQDRAEGSHCRDEGQGRWVGRVPGHRHPGVHLRGADPAGAPLSAQAKARRPGNSASRPCTLRRSVCRTCAADTAAHRLRKNSQGAFGSHRHHTGDTAGGSPRRT